MRGSFGLGGARARRLLVDLSKVVLACAIGIVILDFCVYVFGPRSLMAALPGYKLPLDPEVLSVAGRGFYPKDYFARHSVTGFDIAPNRTAKHFVRDFGIYDVWSNEIGCFDSPVDRDANVEEMIYLAGDSYTWGYAPFEKKFGTILEEEINVPVLKCGVTHTGQRHQYVKFKEIAESLGAYPGTVIVNYVANDIANDYAFPHTTVIEGWQVDNRRLDPENRIVDIPESELRARVTALISDADFQQLSWKAVVLHFSATAGLIDRSGLIDRLTRKLVPARDSVRTRRADRRTRLRDIYSLVGLDPHAFSSEWSSENRDAILSWQEDSIANSYRLVFCLIPPKQFAGNAGYYRDLKMFLSEHGIEHYDFSDSDQVDSAAASVQDFYWKMNGHFSYAGEAAYAEFLKDVL